MERPEPRTVRDLRLMYETCGYVDGTIEHKRLLSLMNIRDYHEGDITGITLSVVPVEYKDKVYVSVYREQVTNLRDGAYCPHKLIDWQKSYTFDEFRDSPFYDMCIDKWGSSAATSWDTHEMDEHEVGDEDSRWWLWAHVYEHRRDWLGNWRKTGRISSVSVDLDEDGNMVICLNGDNVVESDVWSLSKMVDEYERMQEKLEKLKEHGIELEDGILSIRLFDE